MKRGLCSDQSLLVEHQLEAGQSFLLLIEPDVAGVARCFPLTGDVIPIVSDSIPLAGDSLSLVLSRLALP